MLGDYIVLDDTAVVPAPRGLSYEEAAALPTAGLTAWMAVNGHRAVKPGDVVLVQGTYQCWRCSSPSRSART